MGEVSTIGVDIAKSVFQIHGVDTDGTVVIRKRIGRAKVLEFFAGLPPCLVGMEACATAHQWAPNVVPELLELWRRSVEPAALTDNAAAPAFVAYWTNNGQSPGQAIRT
jgi:hypothetical protein